MGPGILSRNSQDTANAKKSRYYPDPGRTSELHRQDNTSEGGTAKPEGRKHGWKFAIRNQPANSPDVNVLDLGFLNSIQAIQHKKAPRTIDELVKGCSALLSNGGSIFRE